MADQHYRNHKQYVPGFHFFTATLCVVILVMAILNFAQVGCSCGWVFSGLMPLLVAITLVMLFWYSRAFSVKVQDRAIAAEENFRHFVITGKPLDTRLSRGQIIALRFAGDDEYMALMQRAIDELMKPDDIKKAIKNWRRDDHRA